MSGVTIKTGYDSINIDMRFIDIFITYLVEENYVATKKDLVSLKNRSFCKMTDEKSEMKKICGAYLSGEGSNTTKNKARQLLIALISDYLFCEDIPKIDLKIKTFTNFDDFSDKYAEVLVLYIIPLVINYHTEEYDFESDDILDMIVGLFNDKTKRILISEEVCHQIVTVINLEFSKGKTEYIKYNPHTNLFFRTGATKIYSIDRKTSKHYIQSHGPNIKSHIKPRKDSVSSTSSKVVIDDMEEPRKLITPYGVVSAFIPGSEPQARLYDKHKFATTGNTGSYEYSSDSELLHRILKNTSELKDKYLVHNFLSLYISNFHEKEELLNELYAKHRADKFAELVRIHNSGLATYSPKLSTKIILKKMELDNELNELISYSFDDIKNILSSAEPFTRDTSSREPIRYVPDIPSSVIRTHDIPLIPPTSTVQRNTNLIALPVVPELMRPPRHIAKPLIIKRGGDHMISHDESENNYYLSKYNSYKKRYLDGKNNKN